MAITLPQSMTGRVGREREVLAVPMPCNVEARGHPHAIEFFDVIEEADEARGTARAPGQPAVQPDRHHFGRLGTFFIESVERVAQIAEERPPFGKPWALMNRMSL